MERKFLEEHLIRGTADLPVGIYSVDAAKEGHIPLHYHREFEFLVVTHVKAKIQLEGNAVYLNSSEGIFINSQTLHTSVNITENDDFSFIAIVFSPELIAPEYDNLYKRFIRPIIKNKFALPVVLPDEIVNIIMKTKKISDRADFGYELAIKGNILQMLSIYIANAEKHSYTKNTIQSEIVKKTLDYIHMNYPNAITLRDLASHAHISKEHLCCIFRDISDTSPIVYLNRYRTTQSAYMLRNTNKSISEISSLCGFNNGSYFDKMFMRFMKCTPSEYRNKK